MKTKLLLAAAIAALSFGATSAIAAPASAPAVTDIAIQGDVAVEQAKHKFHFGYYYYGYPYYNYYYYKPYYPYYCPYWKKIKGWC